MARKKRQFRVQDAIKRPGRTRAYLKRVFGDKAFTKDGKIKATYLEIAIERVKNSKLPEDKKRSLLSALFLAKRLRSWRKKK